MTPAQSDAVSGPSAIAIHNTVSDRASWCEAEESERLFLEMTISDATQSELTMMRIAE